MKKTFLITFGCVLFSTCIISCKNKTTQPQNEIEQKIVTEVSTPAPLNPYLASGEYVISGLNSASTNSFNNNIDRHSYQVYSGVLQDIIPTIASSMILNSPDNNCCWISGADEIIYLSLSDGNLKPLSKLSLSSTKNSDKRQASILKFATKNYTTGDSLKTALHEALGSFAKYPLHLDKLALVDKNNVLHRVYNNKLLSITLQNDSTPEKGLKIINQLELKDLFSTEDMPVGLQMLFDGNLLLNSREGHFCVISRDSLKIKNQLQIAPRQLFFGPVAIDEKNGVYALSDTLIMKLVWNGMNLSCNTNDGAWNYPITFDTDSLLMAKGGGMLASPSLMGFGSDPDKLVIVADGAKRANLLALWRDEIPTDSTKTQNRLAGKIPVNCGNYSGNDFNFLQSYHSLPVYGYGTLFTNTINGYPTPTNLEDYALLGSIIPCPKGIERFEWDYKNHRWLSIWSEPEVATSGMVPVICTSQKIVLLNSFDSDNAITGWNIKGFDWVNGNIINQIIFSSNTQYGNGLNSYVQFLEDGDMIFNSIGGIYRVSFGDKEGSNKAPRL